MKEASYWFCNEREWCILCVLFPLLGVISKLWIQSRVRSYLYGVIGVQLVILIHRSPTTEEVPKQKEKEKKPRKKRRKSSGWNRNESILFCINFEDAFRWKNLFVVCILSSCAVTRKSVLTPRLFKVYVQLLCTLRILCPFCHLHFGRHWMRWWEM